MPEIVRNRDCIALYKGDTFPVITSDTLVNQGWQGGQGVMWTPGPGPDPMVGIADGYYAGFVLFGSNEVADQYTAYTGQYTAYRYLVVCAGGWIITTRTFETYTYASRQVGPLVPLTYSYNDKLYFSLRGYWTKEDEWTLSGDPRAPNTFNVGAVIKAPSPETNGYLTVEVSI